MTYVVTQNCCNDATCVQVCPVNCIHPAPGEPGYATTEMLYIDPAVCIDCGACADVCPVDAISSEDELPESLTPYLELNADHYARTNTTSGPAVVEPARAAVVASAATSTSSPLRVAIVGSGPSACYAAEELLSRREIDVEVTMIERLPFAGGLVRYGVAPDHARTKSVDRTFARTIRRDGMTFHLNVEVGRDVSVEEVLAHHHAVLFASGATQDRRLGIPGEDLAGSHSAREFVAWYNGHPDHAERTFDLSHPRAVIVGNGNVALDVARILVSNVADLRHTDIADHALDALAHSAVREVVVLGRRGPEFAACTTPELLGLGSMPGVDIVVDGDVDQGCNASMKARVLAGLVDRPATGRRRITLRFNAPPTEVLGTGHVSGIKIGTSDGVEDIDCGLILRSIGYRGAAFPGLPFDEHRGTIANTAGRVCDPESGDPVPGRYVAGWIKRGPTGVIGTNRFCAQETVAAIIEDHRAGFLAAPTAGAAQLDELIRVRRPEAMVAADWFELDRAERTEGRLQGRPRVKLIDPAAILATRTG